MLDSVNPNLLSFISAIFVAVSQSLYRQAVRDLNPHHATLVANFAVTIYASLLYLALGGGVPWPWMGIFYFILAGLFANMVARHTNNVSYQKIGLARTQILNQVQPVWASFIAIIFLGERITPLIAAGTLAVVFGGMLLVKDDRRSGQQVPMRHYMIPILGGLSFACAPTLRKLAFFYIPSPAFGIACANLAAGLVHTSFLPLLGSGHRTRSNWTRRTVATILAAALVNVITAYLFWTAIKNGEIVEVIPIRRLSVLFVILSSWLFFRRLERITMRVVVGALVSMAGAAAVAIAGH